MGWAELRDTFGAMIERQVAQQEALHGPLPPGRPEQVALAKDYAQYMIGELYEYLDSIGYKSFLPDQQEKPRETRMIELVDVFKYFLCLCWTEGVSAKELADAFVRKTNVVYERQHAALSSPKLCGFDIDGVLAQQEDWLPCEECFIDRDGVRKLKPMPGASELTHALKSAGYDIIIVTSRKRYRFARLEADTYDWLRSNNIAFDRVLWGYDKMELVKQFGAKFAFHVDDSLKHAIDIAQGGIPVYWMDPVAEQSPHPNIEPIQTLHEVAWHVLNDSR